MSDAAWDAWLDGRPLDESPRPAASDDAWIDAWLAGRDPDEPAQDARLNPIEAWLDGRAPAGSPPRPAAAFVGGGNLSGLVRTVDEAVKGERNTRLHWAACRAAEDVAAGKADADDASQQLLDAALRVGLGRVEAVKTIRSGFKATPRGGSSSPTNPFERWWLGDAAPTALPAHQADAAVLNGAADIRDRFPRLDLAALVAADRPPREFVVSSLVPRGAAVAVVAPGGTGKSLFVLALCLDLVRGRTHFAGLRLPQRRRVLLVDAENTEDDLADRLRDLGITPANVAELNGLVLLHLPALSALDTVVGGAELSALLDAYEVTSEDVVVLDSFQRVVQGKENDSDTLRDYYRHTGVMLKRRGITVIRTDNTGKDADRGARGTSGKRDDVDVELLVTPHADDGSTLRIKPGKVRLPGIEQVLVRRDVDADGRLSFTTAGDPFRTDVNRAVELLDQLDVPPSDGQRKASTALRDAGHEVRREVLRVAVKERRIPSHMLRLGAPDDLGAPFLDQDQSERAEPTRRHGAPAVLGRVSAGHGWCRLRRTPSAHPCAPDVPGPCRRCAAARSLYRAAHRRTPALQCLS